MRKLLLYLFVFFISTYTGWAQTKIVLDNKVIGGFNTGYYELENNGFLLQYSKTQNVDLERDKKSGKVNLTFYYFSRDLSKRASLRELFYGNIVAKANDKHIVLMDVASNKINIHFFDYTGRKVKTSSQDLNSIGLTANQVSNIYLTNNSVVLFEVIDINKNTHLFYVDAFDKNTDIAEAYIPQPSSEPLKLMANVSNWKFLQEFKGFYVFYRQGTNANYNATSAAYHLAFYNSDFSLFRELLIDNILQEGQSLLSADLTLVLNQQTDNMLLSGIILNNGRAQALNAAYVLSSKSAVMKQNWRQQTDLINNAPHYIIDDVKINVPPPPSILINGVNSYTLIGKGKGTMAEEKLNQLIGFNNNGQVVYNKVQKGNYEGLNLDSYCVDADNMYDRIYKLKMNSTLKSYCESLNVEVLDIYLDNSGFELAVVKDNGKKQVIIYMFK